MVLMQWQHHQLEGKEPSGNHTGAAGEDISKRGQGAKFEMHGTAPCLKPLLPVPTALQLLEPSHPWSKGKHCAGEEPVPRAMIHFLGSFCSLP